MVKRPEYCWGKNADYWQKRWLFSFDWTFTGHKLVKHVFHCGGENNIKNHRWNKAHEVAPTALVTSSKRTLVWVQGIRRQFVGVRGFSRKGRALVAWANAFFFFKSCLPQKAQLYMPLSFLMKTQPAHQDLHSCCGASRGGRPTWRRDWRDPSRRASLTSDSKFRLRVLRFALAGVRLAAWCSKASQGK